MTQLAEHLAALSPEKRRLLELRLQKQGIDVWQLPIVPQTRRDRAFPLSFAQQRLWFLEQWAPGNPFYNLPRALRVTGQLNVTALLQSLNHIVQRHEVLRSTCTTLEGQPLQLVSPGLDLPVTMVDLRGLPESARQAAVVRLTAVEARRPFDLSRGPLLRLTLLRPDEQEHVLLLTLHHMIADGWSMGILIREVVALYEACSTGRPSLLPALPMQYVDFATWQRQWLQADRLEAHFTYWKRQLGGSPAVLALPTDHPRPAVNTLQGACQTFVLPATLTARLKALSEQAGVTLFMTLLAAFQTLLYRYTGQSDISVGTAVANRHRVEVEGLIGFFANMLVLRADLAGNPRFYELLERVRNVALGAYAHQDCPFEMLVEALQPERHMSHTPLFQVAFILQNVALPALQLPGLSLQLLEAHSGTARFDLTLSMMEEAGRLSGSLEYCTDLFDAATITRLWGHYRTVLEGVVAAPEQRLTEVPLLTAAERQQLLGVRQSTRRDYPHDKGLHELFEAEVERTPEAVAIVCEDAAVTYGALNARANQLAHYLRRQGVRAEVLVGICPERSLDLLVGLLGILKAGGAYVPLDPAYPQERLAFMLEDSQTPVLLTQQRLREELPAHHARLICLDSDWASIAQESMANPGQGTMAEQLAYVLYTSGSTGQPKGVQIPHRAVVNFLRSMQQQPGLTAQDVLLAVTTLAFDIAALEVFLPLLVGARVVLLSRAVAADGQQLLQTLVDTQATVMQATPATWRLLLAAGWAGSRQLTVLCGGETLPQELAQQLLERAAAVWNLYGPTETTIWSTASRLLPGEGPVALGHPIANTQLYVLDRSLHLLPVGIPGELHIGGVGVARGYRQRPELTAERFLGDPFSDDAGARLYKTGDLVRYRADGSLEFLGRLDQQVKLRGFRLELGEIEAGLRQHPAVREAVVVAREENDGDKRLLAYIVPHLDSTPTLSELRSFLQTKLPDYMLPTALVSLATLPLTPNGKVDRRALPAPDNAGPEPGHVGMAPRTLLEEQVVRLWADILRHEPIGIHDNFFALGGHSLLAAQVMARLSTTLRVELPLRTLFETPTVAGLAERLETARQAGEHTLRPALTRVAGTGPLPLSFAQQRLWFLDQLAPGDPVYNSTAATRLTGPLNVAALVQAFGEVVRRHEVLRTIFHTVAGQPVQVITPSRPLLLSEVDLRQVATTAQEQTVQRLATAIARQPCDLSRGPLLRGTMLQLHAEEHVMVLTMPHIVSDGWSTGILIREVVALYSAYSAGAPSPLPELPLQYVDFAHWQRQWLQGEVLQNLLSYWQRQLAGAPPVLELSVARPRPQFQTFRGARQSLLLPNSLKESLQALGQQEGATLFMTLLATFKVMLHAYTGHNDLVVGTDVANRHRVEFEELIGFFVNLLVLRTDLRGNPTLREFLRRVRQVVIGAYDHQELPFEQLVAALQPARHGRHTPFVQVLFVLQNTPAPTLKLPGLQLQPVEIHSGTARFDIGLFLQETPQGLSGTWNYNTDLFDATTVSRMSEHFTTLLETIVAQPEARLHWLTLLLKVEKKARIMEDTRHSAANFAKFKNIKPKAVNLGQRSMITTSSLQPGTAFPLVIQPAADHIDPAGWAAGNRQFIEAQLTTHGALLFRGFPVSSVQEFERFALALCPELFGEYGDLPREDPGNKIYHSTPYPPEQAILFHNEASHTHQWPLKQWFFCVQAAPQGGETPIVDCRKVYQDLAADIRQRFEQQHVMYVRNFINGLDMSWQEFFHTTQREQVEAYCRSARIACTWLENDGLTTRQRCPAVARHPQTGEMVFFNQIQLHHISCLEPATRDSLLSMFGADRLPRNVYYGDGSPIEDAVVTEIREVYQRHASSFPWQETDILMVDNMLVAHGRQPFVGPRKIVVAMGEMLHRAEAWLERLQG